MTSGAMILDVARAHLQRFVSFPSQAAADIATVWAAGTHVVGTDDRLLFDTFPRIGFFSDLPGSGKTSALERTLSLAFHGELVLGPTPMSFCTMISERRSSVGIDEVDNMLGAGAAKADLRAILNAGYKRNSTGWTRGKQAPMSVYAPVGLAGLCAKFLTAAELAPLRQRTVIIQMQPAPCPEMFKERDHGPMTTYYRDQLTRWAKLNRQAILSQRPEPVPGIENRMWEVCEALFMLADAAGGHWPESIREAARALLLGEVSQDDSDDLPLHERLLLDLKAVFEAEQATKLPSRDLVGALYDLPASEWSKLWPNRNTAPRELAMILAPLGVEPRSIRLGSEVLNGYHREGLECLWSEIVSNDDHTFAPTNESTNESTNAPTIIDLDAEVFDIA